MSRAAPSGSTARTGVPNWFARSSRLSRCARSGSAGKLPTTSPAQGTDCAARASRVRAV
ncbi:Uncharacterised protein [Mycobacteroides abscessus subsp. abscessus]|nr:Uncharacterised protein [Mycobacteroides abscessus subsp. abscessus]